MVRHTFILLLLCSGLALTTSVASGHTRLLVHPSLDFRVRQTDTLVRPDSLKKLDSLLDSLDNSFDLHGVRHKRGMRPHIFVLNETSKTEETPYRENPAIIDFNRVTGFYLGVATSGMSDLGPHDEIGLNASAGYGFADARWEYLFGPEFRLPLVNMERIARDSARHTLFAVPTLAFGGELHNITATDDPWRVSRLENAADAFFTRQDFRDYYKLAGWDAYVAFRPRRNNEFRVEWREDHYQSLSQEVFYGRWGGDKALPVNPSVAEGTMRSLVLTDLSENVHPRVRRVGNVFGDSVWIEQLVGRSSMTQFEMGHMPGSDFGFNRWQFDGRYFWPILNGLNLDTRIRWQATMGDITTTDSALLWQKLEFLGGPGSLPALYNKSLVGNRLVLINTELRLNLNMLSSVFHSSDANLIVFNDFGRISWAANGDGMFSGYGPSGLSSILYNVGVGLGWTRGFQIGATWRTDIKDDPRWIFRLQRAF